MSPFHSPLAQYGTVLFHTMKYWLVPAGSIPSENTPGAGSPEFFQVVSTCASPVTLFSPSRAPGSHVSVG